MAIKRLTLLACLVLLGATPAAKKEKAVDPAKVPDKLQPYIELSKLCAEYEKQVTVVAWRDVWKQTFDANTADKWVTPPAAPADPNAAAAPKPRATVPTVTAERVDERDCAVLDATDMQNSFFAVGNGPLRGEFAVEFVGKAMSDRPCDLSISCTRGGETGPGFEFGAHWNQSSFLRAITPEGQLQRTAIQNPPLIEKDRWYKIRFEIRGGKVTASIDGKEVGSAKSNTSTDRPWTPNIYIYQSKIAVDEVRIEAMAASASTIDPAAAFTKVFGDRPRDQVMQQIGKLVEALDDNDSRVRDAAHVLLKPMGTLTREALQGAIDSGSAEQMSRAQQLMDLLPAPTTRPAN